MLIDINKIVVNDRIRHDYGDLDELAEDIRSNGLINPPVVNKAYELLAGERRLRACKLLGWPTIEVRMMDTRDAEHELNIEISENDVRKGFTKSERVDYMKRLLRIEQAKAKERQDLGLKSDEGSRADDATAKQFGIGRDTMRREMEIADNRDLLDPTDFADWDEGKLSTNKAFQRIKAAMAQAEKERDEARKDAEKVSELYGKVVVQRDEAREDLASERAKNLELGSQIANLRHQASEKPEPEVIEREVVPEETRKTIRELERSNKQFSEDYEDLRRRFSNTQAELKQARSELATNEAALSSIREIQALTRAMGEFVGRYSGHAWPFADVDEQTMGEFARTLGSLSAFVDALKNDIHTKEEN